MDNRFFPNCISVWNGLAKEVAEANTLFIHHQNQYLQKYHRMRNNDIGRHIMSFFVKLLSVCFFSICLSVRYGMQLSDCSWNVAV